MKIIRQIDVFEKSSDYIFDEIEIKKFDLEAIKLLITNSKNDPLLYNGYKIEGKLRAYFEKNGYEFFPEKYDYFLCCYQDNNSLKSK